jgi:hypothetical protein
MHTSRFQIRYKADVLEHSHPDELFHVIGYLLSVKDHPQRDLTKLFEKTDIDWTAFKTN